MADNDKRGGERVPAALRLKLRYTDVETFIDKYAANVSKGGIFIASRTPKPAGSLLRFEFQLADGSPVVRGEGKVVWVKEFDPAQPQKPHGMGLKFTRLDTRSRAILDRMLSLKGQPRGDGSGMAPLPAEGSAPRPMPTEGSGPQAVAEGSAPRALPSEASEPLIVTEGSAPRPLPSEASEPLIVTEASGMRPLPAEGSAPRPWPSESSAPRPLPAEGSGPVLAAEGSTPHPRPIPPTIPIAITLGVQPALEELDRLATEIGFTDAALAAALERARQLAAGANGDLGALLDDVPEAPAAPAAPRAPRARPATPPLPPGAARATARAPSFDQEEETDVDRARREGRAPGAAAPDEAHEPTPLDLSSPERASPDPAGTEPPDDSAGPPRKGRLGAVVKKILGQ